MVPEQYACDECERFISPAVPHAPECPNRAETDGGDT